MKNFIKALLCLTTMLVLVTNSGNVYAAIAGHVQFVHGTVQLTTATGVTHAIKKGEAVNEGDTLVSAQTASAQIRMEDGGIVAMRADTKLQIDRFTFNGQQDGTEQSFFSLFKGGFRAITGLIGKEHKANYRITTPATTIGIRGTDHEIFVVTPDSSLAAATPIGTYNKVNLGETSMTTEKGTVFVLPNQMGFAGAADKVPQLQPINLNIFTVTPTPQTGGDKHDGQREGGRDVRENATTDRNEMRETTTMDKNETRGTSTTDRTRGESAATLAPSREDAGTNTMSPTAGGVPDQPRRDDH
jgi:hypothetical protein